MTDISKGKKIPGVKSSDNSDNGPKRDLPNKKEEFEKFLELIGRKSVGHWVEIANALGVDQDTITAWKKYPMAQKVIRDEIEKSLEGMEESGKKDWKMWESRLKMLGVSPIEKSDISSLGEKVQWGVISYEQLKDGSK